MTDPRLHERREHDWFSTLKGHNGEGWGQFVGEYSGSYLYLLNVSEEANTIAEAICTQRDIWKQNQSQAIAFIVQKMLDAIDAAK